ncbi:MAG TPA: ATP-binding cassette domain-containing protein [Planctomycetota bacterium]|nr:ATP-binding cassette domain-containing protein [Planctomycetota bacterium]
MIQVEDVSRSYGRVLAVDRASFGIREGEIVGFLGPNGAGKSTLLKLISTWLEPDSGRIRVAGHDTRDEPLAVRRALGYLAEHNALYEGMRVRGYLEFVGRVRGLGRARLAERIAWVNQRCGLEAVLARRIHECSKGYRQRVGVAAALLHDPRVILLDEPTHGLDPLQVVAFRDFVRSLAPGRAILFSSHILSEVLTISERALVIQRGRLILDEDVGSLQRRAAERATSVEELILDHVRGSATGAAAPVAEAGAR